MKRLIVAMIVVLAAALTVAHAGKACCGVAKKTAKAEGAACTKTGKTWVEGECLKSLELSEDQQTKVDKLVENCKGSECTKEKCAEVVKELKEILTEDQLAQWKAACGERGCKNPLAELEKKESGKTEG